MREAIVNDTAFVDNYAFRITLHVAKKSVIREAHSQQKCATPRAAPFKETSMALERMLVLSVTCYNLTINAPVLSYHQHEHIYFLVFIPHLLNSVSLNVLTISCTLFGPLWNSSH